MHRVRITRGSESGRERANHSRFAAWEPMAENRSAPPGLYPALTSAVEADGPRRGGRLDAEGSYHGGAGNVRSTLAEKLVVHPCVYIE